MIYAVLELKQDIIEFTQEMIRIPSYTGDEEALARSILAKLNAWGIDDAFIDGIGNVVGVVYGHQPGPGIMLNGHLDVVPPGDLENWKAFDPFGGEIDAEGNIRGRGASDLKGGLAAQLFALKLVQDLKQTGTTINGNLIFSAVVNEESATMFGMEYLMHQTLAEKDLDCDLVFLCEPSGLDVILGHKGKVELVVTTKGRTAHSSNPKAGRNALQKMVPVLDAIFNEMSADIDSHPLLGDSSVTVTNLICRPGTLSIIPDECEISVDRRYLPGQRIEDLLEEFKTVFRRIEARDPHFQATVATRQFTEKSYTGYEKKVQKFHPPWITDDNHDFVRQTLSALEGIGQNPSTGYWHFGTDGSMSAGLMGIPTIGYSGAREQYAHTADEQINIDMLVRSVEGYYAIVCKLLGLNAF